MSVRMRSVAEIVFRFRQYTWNLADRLGIIGGYSACDARHSSVLRTGTFFLDASAITGIRAWYTAHPEQLQSLLDRADAVCAGRYRLLGFVDLDFARDGVFNWHYDPVNRAVVARCWWQQALAEASLHAADPKIIWELNRHQHLVLLAQAYVASGNDRYRTEVVRQLQLWMDTNPPKYGINWASSLELAYRSIAWLWAWFLCGAGEAFGELTGRFLETIALHAEHVEHNLSVYYSPNTHLSGEALGLLYIGTLLPNLPGAARWRDTGERWMRYCLDFHVLADGGYMERAFWYHRYTADIFLHYYLLYRANGKVSDAKITERLCALGRFLLCSLQPDGRIPHIGDDDGGRLLPLDGRPGDDPAGLLHCLAELGCGDKLPQGPPSAPEEVLWLLGPEAASGALRVSTHPDNTSYILKESGYAFLRSGWEPDAVYISFDCGPHGWLNCGHAHADMLSIQVFKGLVPIIIDPGTYSYQPPWRDWFRSAGAHAIIRVNGEYPAIPAAPFQWSEVPKHEGLCLRRKNGHISVSGSMYSANWRHDREIVLVGNELIVVLDRVTVHNESSIEVRFPLAGTGWQICADCCSKQGASIRWDFGMAVQASCEDGWQSACYGNREPATVLVVRGMTAFPVSLATLIDLGNDEYHIHRNTDHTPETFIVNRRTDGQIAALLEPAIVRNPLCAVSAG
ncbi:MAG: hypothetical protein BWK76_21850 [Desulfobulbaceae bacterium A2]|nr:MAG: hypothetical protein BWK76_21850 [Desulfobulbaceae bacterium A2]